MYQLATRLVVQKNGAGYVDLCLDIFYLFYNDYETSYTTYINHARWHRCLRWDGLR